MWYIHPVLRLIVPVLLITTLAVAQAADEQQLKKALESQIVVLKVPVKGKDLRYDADGKLRGGTPGDWSFDANLEIKKVQLKSEHVEFEVNRLVAYPDGKRLAFLRAQSAKLRVEIPANATNQQLLVALRRVFVSSPEERAQYTPADWREYVAPADPNAPAIDKVPEGLAKPGGDILPPKPLRMVEPEYSMEAHGKRYQCTCLLQVVVDERGAPAPVRVVRPCGNGLDQEAIKAVSQWRFEPARNKNTGQPVRMLVNVEVAFNLYND